MGIPLGDPIFVTLMHVGKSLSLSPAVLFAWLRKHQIIADFALCLAKIDGDQYRSIRGARGWNVPTSALDFAKLRATLNPIDNFEHRWHNDFGLFICTGLPLRVLPFSSLLGSGNSPYEACGKCHLFIGRIKRKISSKDPSTKNKQGINFRPGWIFSLSNSDLCWCLLVELREIIPLIFLQTRPGMKKRF